MQYLSFSCSVQTSLTFANYFAQRGKKNVDNMCHQLNSMHNLNTFTPISLIHTLVALQDQQFIDSWSYNEQNWI